MSNTYKAEAARLEALIEEALSILASGRVQLAVTLLKERHSELDHPVHGGHPDGEPA